MMTMARYVLMVVTVCAMWPFSGKAADLKTGEPAPAFELIDQYNKPHRLGDYAGRWVVLYFYPKDDTPGCTTEACNFRDDILEVQELGAVILGVSLDSTESHAKFAEKHGLPFPLLSDSGGRVAEQYGCLTSIGPLKFAKRETFIIAPDGRIAHAYPDVKPEKHSQEVIADLKTLQSR
ncbi:MAG: peroxiredoxin [Gammaproteobacteria bacterium]|nr:peroxiredoxin [Gammaproteobacteria bacterium]